MSDDALMLLTKRQLGIGPLTPYIYTSAQSQPFVRFSYDERPDANKRR